MIAYGTQFSNQLSFSSVHIIRNLPHPMSWGFPAYAGAIAIEVIKEPLPNISFAYIDPYTFLKKSIYAVLILF